MPRQYVLDTNVLISDPFAIFRFEEHHVVIPLLVIEELDHIKDSPRKVDIQHEARCAIQFINAVVNGHPKNEIREGMPLVIDPAQPVLADGHLKIVNHLEMLQHPEFKSKSDELGISMDSPDNQILMVVHQLSKQSDMETVLVTKDLNMRLKAKYLGLLVEDYKNEQDIKDVSLMSKGFIYLDAPLTSCIEHAENHCENRNQFNLDAEELKRAVARALDAPEQQDLHVNQMLVDPDDMDSVWRVQSEQNGPLRGQVSLSHHSVSQLMSKQAFGIKPKDLQQAFAIQALLDPDIDLVVISGAAGTGKTLMALAAALEQTVESKRYNKIIVTRNTLDMGEPIGFLPGSEEEKMAPWLGAFTDAIETLSAQSSGSDKTGDHHISGHKGKMPDADAKSQINEMLQSKIQFRSMTFMRGRSVQNAFLILDESQNLTRSQIKSMVTRVGAGSKIVILGNIAQIDARYNTPTSNGLISAVQTFKHFRKGAHVILERGQRSDVASFAEEHL